MSHSIEDVRQYWDSHLNLTQFLDSNIEVGSDEFYRLLESTLDRYEYKRSLLENFAQRKNGQKLLEIGSGLGLELGLLGQLGFDVTGIDLAPTAVDVCNDYLKSRGVHGRAMVQNAEQLELSDSYFDVVYTSGVIQHTPNIDRAIAEIWRVLKPGGEILVILYHRRSWFYMLHKLGGYNIEFASDDAPIINAYTRKDLKNLFTRFSNIQIDCEYYYPERTNRSGVLASLYNGLFVPGMKILPEALVRNFGWHLVLRASK
jgi:ubiquinone/menaquinone biosynthesis C-methylase UbiE